MIDPFALSGLYVGQSLHRTAALVGGALPREPRDGAIRSRFTRLSGQEADLDTLGG